MDKCFSIFTKDINGLRILPEYDTNEHAYKTDSQIQRTNLEVGWGGAEWEVGNFCPALEDLCSLSTSGVLVTANMGLQRGLTHSMSIIPDLERLVL